MASVSYASVLLLVINYIITLSTWLWNYTYKPQAGGSAVNLNYVISEFYSK